MRRFVLLLALAASLVSCQSAESEIRSIEEIAASGPPVITDITPYEAVLLFESSIPLACSVVYGETTEYGSIATDSDMAGGAHADHHPLLSGLEADTLYHYRVQGTAADGTLYMSEDFTFQTPPADAAGELNLASLEEGARVVEVSSSFGGASDGEPWGALSAIDSNRGTAWSSDGDGDEAYIVIEFVEPAAVEAVEVWSRSMTDGTAEILAFTLTTDSGEEFGPFEIPSAEESARFEVSFTTLRIRLDVAESTGGNTGLVEFAAYGEYVGE